MIQKEETISLIRVSDLLKERFFIPSYQRGYRWTSRQVEDLLDDIRDFTRTAKEGEFYCLQPLVLKPLSHDEARAKKLDENQWYEVIDGQQRLTTIKILYSYFVKNHSAFDSEEEWRESMMKIEYETREETGRFLDSLINENTEENNTDCQDIYFIKQAYRVIDKWFNDIDVSIRKRIRNKMADTLSSGEDGDEGNPLKFIVYLDSSTPNPIDIFERINIGKIKLTNAELIRAIFLLKSNYIGTAFDKSEETLLAKQFEIANEWDAIEHFLQNEKFWYFLSNEDSYHSSRIGLIFDLMFFEFKGRMPNNLDDYQTFRFFNDTIHDKDNPTNIIDLWDKAKQYYYDIRDWFEDKELYHYVGWLTKECLNPISCIAELHGLYSASKDKEIFRKKIKEKVKTKLNVKCVVTKTMREGKLIIDNVEFPDLNYHSSKKILREFYLLLNAQQTVNSVDENARFPFDLYIKEKWNIEHVDSHTENSLTKPEEKEAWLQVALSSLNHDQVELYNNSIDENSTFEEKRSKIREIVGEELDENSEDEKNSVGNLTLLDEETNKSYGNQIFLHKRNIILNKEKRGKLILPSTRNVFLKYFSDSPTSIKWTINDINDYKLYIYETLSLFLYESEVVTNE